MTTTRLGSRARKLAVGFGLVVVAALGTALACESLRWQPIGPRRTAAIAGAEPVGAEECGVCHEAVQGHERIATYHASCESCHGPGSVHVDSEEAADIRFPANQDCLACHALGYASHLEWGTGEHARAGVLCSDCHNPHLSAEHHLRAKKQPGFRDLDRASSLCIECHRDVASQLNFPSHHPVREGAMGCLDCHNPHEDRRIAFGDANRTCKGCHQDYIGPWIFEHPPVIEDCTICHNPHGAVTTNLLETVQPVICISCHTMNDMWHHETAGTGILGQNTISQDRPTAPGEQITQREAITFLNQCTNCHGAVHGSLTDEHLRH